MSSGCSRRSVRNTQKRRKDQTKQVYQSEWEVFPEHFSRSDFSSIREIQGFVNYVQLSSVWRSLGGPTGTVVKDNGDHDHSCATSENEIWISKPMRTRQTVLHELAHLAGDWGHGPRFVRALLTLTSNFMGLHYHELLLRSFRRNNVSW